MTSTSGDARTLSIELDQLKGASLILLPMTTDGDVNLYPEWAPDLARQLREAGITVAWATKNRGYVHAFSAEVEAVVQIALLLAEPITQAAASIVVGYLRALTSPRQTASGDIKIYYATQVELPTGKVSDFSSLTIPADAAVDIVGITKEFNAGRIAGIEATQNRE